MTTLKEVLGKKDKIKELAEQFGFKNIRIYHEQGDEDKSLLNLVVESQKYKHAVASMHRKSYLKAKLIDLLNCQVHIINYNCVDNLYKYDIDVKSASIDDEPAMQTLLKDNVVYVGLEAKETRTHKIVLNRAEAYLKKYCSEFTEQDRKQLGVGYQSLMSSASHSEKVTTEKDELARPKKKPRLEFDDSDEAVLLRIPIIKDFQLTDMLTNMSSSERETIAEQLTEHFYKCISKAPTFVK